MTQLPLDNPFLEWLGASLHDWSPDYAEMHLPMSEKLANRSGRVHGGVMCTLLDSVAGYSGLYSAPDEPLLRGLTLSLTTNFISAGIGETLVAKGFVERRGRNIYFSRAEVRLDDALLLATAVGTFKYLAPR